MELELNVQFEKDYSEKFDNNVIKITNHAFQRSKERFGLSKIATYRMSEKAFKKGLSVDDMSGALQKHFTTKLGFDWNQKIHYRVYGNAIYVFAEAENAYGDNTYPLLLTVTTIPKSLKLQAKGQFKKNKVA